MLDFPERCLRDRLWALGSPQEVVVTPQAGTQSQHLREPPCQERVGLRRCSLSTFLEEIEPGDPPTLAAPSPSGPERPSARADPACLLPVEKQG